MTIKFLAAHEVGAEKFTAGQLVEDRSPESELHFVRRGYAAFVGEDGKLTDHEGREVSEKAETVVVTVAANAAGEPGRAGEVDHPQRATPGPGEMVTTSAVTPGESHKKRGRK